MGFKFSPISKIDFPIVDENDTPIKTYSLDVGSEDFVRALLDKGQRVVKIARDFESDADAFGGLLAAIKDFTNYALGAGAFDFLYARFGKNIFAMIELVRAVTEEGSAALRAKLDQTNAIYGK